MKQKNLLSANLILAIISTVFFGSFFAANSVFASHATAVCETNTMKSGTFCNWTDSNSWCGGGSNPICQLEPDTATTPPTAVANGSWNFCNSCSWTLTCNGGFSNCAGNNTCIATQTCLAGQTFDACSNTCLGSAATLKLAYDSAGGTYLVNSPAPVLSILSTGKVGLGTTAPNDIFSIGNSGVAPVGSLSTGHNYTMTYLSADPYALVNYGTTMSLINAATSSNALFGGTTSGNIWSLNSGNVGIGTTNPSSLLDIYTSQNTDTLLGIRNDNTGTSARAGFRISNGAYSGNSFAFFVTGANYTGVAGWANRGVLSSDSGVLGGLLLRPSVGGFQITADGSLNNPNLVVATTGNVGIGTTAPTQKLFVNGSAFISNNLFMNTMSGSTGIGWYMPSYYTWYDYMKSGGGIGPNGLGAPTDVASGVTGWARRFNTESNGTYGWIFESGGNSTSSAATVKFAINAGTGTFHTIGGGIIDGNLGIGTSIPNDKLSIGNSGVAPVGSLATGHNYTMTYLSADPYALVNYGTTMSLINAATTTNALWNGTKNGNIYNGDAGVGNVGIGTTTPGAALHVYSVTNPGIIVGNGTTGYFKLGDATMKKVANQFFSFNGDGVQGINYLILGADAVDTNSTLSVTANGLKSIYIPRLTGNVGIGTTAPNDTLSIGAGGVSAPVGSLGTGHNNTMTYLSNDNYALINYGTVMTLLNAATSSSNLWGGTKNGNIWNGDAGVGNVGIGTIVPGKKLTVNVSDASGMVPAATSVIRLVNPNTTLGEFTGLQFNFLNDVDAQTTAMIGAVLSDKSSSWRSDLVFGTKQTTGGEPLTEYMRIQAGGNVGVGTTTPAYKLDVNGQFRATGNAFFDAGTFIKDQNSTIDSMWGWYAWDKEFQFNKRTLANVFVQNIFTANWDTGNLALVPTAGNVGIGTANPLTILHAVARYSKTDTTNRTIARFGSNDATNPTSIVFGMTGGATQDVRVNTIQTDEYGVISGGNLSLQPFGGHVGIGVTNPIDILTISGSGVPAPSGSVDTGHNNTMLYLSTDNYALTNYGTVRTLINSAMTSSSTATFVGLSSVVYNGNNNANNGYTYAQARCKADQTGAHVCTPDEILNTIAVGGTMLAEDAWIFSGPPGYIAVANDCNGRSVATNAARGTYWQKADAAQGRPDGRGLLMLCDQSLKLACCR